MSKRRPRRLGSAPPESLLGTAVTRREDRSARAGRWRLTWATAARTVAAAEAAALLCLGTSLRARRAQPGAQDPSGRGGAGRGLSWAARRTPAPRPVNPVPCPTPSTQPGASGYPRSAAALPIPAAAYRAWAQGTFPGRRRPERPHS